LAQRLGLSRQAIHLRLAALRDEGRVAMTGARRGARWQRVFDAEFLWELPPSIGEAAMWREFEASAFATGLQMSPEARRVLNYAVTEMINNAIDHSSGTRVTLAARADGSSLTLVISDDGVGALQHVRQHFDLASDADALAHISKGQQTTAPEHHSGQGLFFTSRMVDGFALDSGTLRWVVDTVRGDQAVAPGSGDKGTRVSITHDLRSRVTPREVFDRFSDQDAGFTRSRVAVRLSVPAGTFVSRSEAKRLGDGLEEFGEVEIDFAEVTEVGQGFVDELFRVWQSRHPDTTLVPINMSPEVEFMVTRGLPDRT
jgi:anti-sigma regulatory factor (Ser/Thr protein kinase)